MQASTEASSQFLRPAALHLLSQGCGQGWLLQFKYTCVLRFRLVVRFVPTNHIKVAQRFVLHGGKDHLSCHAGPPTVSDEICADSMTH